MEFSHFFQATERYQYLGGPMLLATPRTTMQTRWLGAGPSWPNDEGSAFPSPDTPRRLFSGAQPGEVISDRHSIFRGIDMA
jgi:hypothetical protein